MAQAAHVLPKRLFVISDLHIGGPDDPLCVRLIALVRDRLEAGDTLVLAGDIFDLFVGAKPVFLERYGALLGELEAALRRGVKLHYIEGNHDFLLALGGDFFVKRLAGMKIHDSEVAFESGAGGPRIYVAHGDLVDTADRGYLAMRSFFRGRLMRAYVSRAPGAWVDGLGNFLSHQSRERGGARLPEDFSPERLERLRAAYRGFAEAKIRDEGYRFVVLGHCHDLDEAKFAPVGQYMNVGYPRKHGSCVLWGGAGASELVRVRI